tara:strand:- start:260 stop:661 length:402 start_codon:yes stop_codon:yes gene_type:complete
MASTTEENDMYDVPDRPISADPNFQRMWGDDDYVHEMDEVEDNDTQFNLHWFGMDEYLSFDNGIIADTRDEMDRLVDFWIREDNLEIKQHPHNGKESDVHGGLEDADVINGNPAGQYFIIQRGRVIGVVTEVR